MSAADSNFTYQQLKAKLDADHAADLAALQRVAERGLLDSLLVGKVSIGNGSTKQTATTTAVVKTVNPPLESAEGSIKPFRTTGRRTASVQTENAVIRAIKDFDGQYTVAEVNSWLHDTGRPTPRTSVREALEELVERNIVIVVKQGKAGRATIYRNAPTGLDSKEFGKDSRMESTPTGPGWPPTTEM